MKPAIRNLMAGAAVSTLLSACGGADSVATPAPTPPPSAMTLAQQIGAAFNTLFTASSDVEATEPAASSVPTLAPDSEPIAG